MIDKEKIALVSNEMDCKDCIIPEEDDTWSCTYPKCMVDDDDSGWAAVTARVRDTAPPPIRLSGSGVFRSIRHA